MKAQPPRYALRMLRWFCREDYLDEIEGDLVEMFEKRESKSPWRAKLFFLWDVLCHARPEYLKFLNKKKVPHPLIKTDMIRNYFILAFRNLSKRAAFSFINIGGLALGVSTCLMILAYLDFETSFDNFNTGADNIYRIIRTTYRNNEPQQPIVMTTYGYAPALEADVPLVKRAIRTHNESTVVSFNDLDGTLHAFHENDVLITDTAFFDVFTFQQLGGDLQTALRDPNSIVITETIAQKYFGSANPIGKTLTLAGGRIDGNYTVQAVIADVPQNSHFSFNMVLPIHNLLTGRQYKEDDGWSWNNFITYVELTPGTSPAALAGQLSNFTKRHLDSRWAAQNMRFVLALQPLRDIHLRPGLRHDVVTVSPTTLYFFGIIALFILFIAWINYINLSTARSMERAREVGIKKTIGAFKSQLMLQFLVEAFVINLIGIALALMLTTIMLPRLGDIIGKDLFVHFSDARLWIMIASLLVTGIFASGMYPAIVLSSFKITQAIKAERTNGFSLRKALVTFQFVASLLLISGTIVVYRQINYMQSQDKGLQMDQMLIVAGPGSLTWHEAQRRLTTLKEALRDVPGIDAVATSGSIPGREHNWGADVRRLPLPETENKSAGVVWIDTDFIPTYKIALIAGKNFNSHIASDMHAVIINEAAVKAFGLGTPETAIGQQLAIGDQTASVLGVTRNYNWSSLQADYAPFLFLPDTIQTLHVSIHLRGGSIPASIDRIGKIYKQIMPQEPFEYAFLDDTFNAHYRSEQQAGTLMGLFAGLAVAISCLGLWGLASFTTTQKLKEIGVRKVLGASVRSIVVLLSTQFMRLVIVAALIAVPLSWYGMTQWLGGFAFRAHLVWYLFAIPVALLAAITLLTVSLQVFKGARMDPAKILRSE